MFPHTVTLYNTEIDRNPDDITDETIVNHITILRGVLFDAAKAINVRASGLDSADAVNLYIPFYVDATDGVTGEKKEYIDPVKFWKLDDKSKHWTLQASKSTFFIKGEAVVTDPAISDFASISMAYNDVYVVTKVDEKDFGGLQHFEVGGN